MSQNLKLFSNELVANGYVLDLHYEGGSFAGQMEMTALGKEILALEECLKVCIKVLKQNGKIDFGINDVIFYVEPFQKGSFQKKVKLFFKKVEKHPVICGLVGNTLIATATLVVGLQAGKLSASDLALIGDRVSAEVLADPRFRQNIPMVIDPMNSNDDKLTLKAPGYASTTFYQKDKQKFTLLLNESVNELAEVAIDSELATDQEEHITYYGRVTSIDLDATKNVLGFKLEGHGTKIPCSLVDALTASDVSIFLGAWVGLEGLAEIHDDVISHVTIEKIYAAEPPEQGNLFVR